MCVICILFLTVISSFDPSGDASFTLLLCCVSHFSEFSSCLSGVQTHAKEQQIDRPSVRCPSRQRTQDGPRSTGLRKPPEFTRERKRARAAVIS